MPNNGMYPNWEVPESLKWDEFSEALQQTIKGKQLINLLGKKLQKQHIFVQIVQIA